MITSFVLSLREGLEAVLIISIILGVLRRTGRGDLRLALWRGVVVALFVSVITALILFLIGIEVEGRAEEIYEGGTMLLAAAMLTWVIIWMQRQANQKTKMLEGRVEQAAQQKGDRALFMLAFLTVVREGFELAVFLVAAGMTSTALRTLSGALLGLAGAVILGWMLTKGTYRLNVKAFFRATSILLILFAAGLVAHGVHELNEAGLLPPLIEQVYDINLLINDQSLVGSLLVSLFGYNGNPSLMEVVGYWGYLLGILWLMKRLKPVMAFSEARFRDE